MEYKSGPDNSYSIKPTTIGERLRQERERLEFSQTEFGQLGGVTKGTQINYEKGIRSPDGEYLSKIFVVGTDVLFIVTGQRASPLCLPPDELALLATYRNIASQDRKDALRIVGEALMGYKRD